jgi:hypothetical protein
VPGLYRGNPAIQYDHREHLPGCELLNAVCNDVCESWWYPVEMVDGIVCQYVTIE